MAEDFSKQVVEAFKQQYADLKMDNSNMKFEMVNASGCHVTHFEPYNPLIAIYYFDENGKEGVEYIHYSDFDVSVSFKKDKK